MSEQHTEYGEEERVPEHSGTSHSMAIGFYIAAIVLIFGVILTLTGLLAPGLRAQADLGFNVNLLWGLVMVVSGCVILGLSLAPPPRRQGGAPALENHATSRARRRPP